MGSGKMPNSLTLAAVTAVLKHALENGLVEYGIASALGGDVTVSALSPERIAIGAEERAQLNLFLYQVTPQTGLRSQAGPDRGAGPGRNVSTLIKLDLHYLLTAYGGHDLEMEVLLGYGIQQLHAAPVVSQEAVQTALRADSAEDGRVPSPILTALANSGLAEQVKEIRLSPLFLSLEEMSKLWSALQARYRPSAMVKVSLMIAGMNSDSG